ncbi:MAG TPA: hypothetical protein VFE13_05240, partial [Caulobacteraceae bacterium]|nr:hypothetical protein [Caulobacteraceae bacterium]
SLAAAPARAGPPYVTDDPAPTDLGHWEIYNFANGVATPGVVAGEAGLDLNYGAFKDVQATLVLPAAYLAGDGGAVGGGQIEAAAKLKLLHQDGFGLDVAVFPRAFIPTSGGRFGGDHVNLLLPIWVGRDIGKWQVFGGGGYQINPGPGARNFWTGGLAVTRDVSERLNLGAEIYAHTPDAVDARRFVGVNVGAALRLTPHWSLLAAGGPGLQNARSEGQYDFYVALKADY